MVRAPSSERVQFSRRSQQKRDAMSESGPDPERLRKLGARLDDVQKRDARQRKTESITPAGIALRLSTELAAGLVVGIGFGWGIDWLFGFFGIHTKPVFIVVFFVLGAIAGRS